MLSEERSGAFDLGAYLARVGYAGTVEPSLPVLEALHLAHVSRIPFENLDILLGRPIRLDPEGLQAKLVRGGRGGYCFEQNTLFGAALETIGFEVLSLSARVRLGAARLRPRTHKILRVDLDGAAWLADVGFGSGGLLGPLLMFPGQAQRQYAWSFRLMEERGSWVLQSLRGSEWTDLYAYTLEPQYPVDDEMAHYFTSTHPSSPFVKEPIVQLSTPEARYALRGRSFTVDRGGEVLARTIDDDDELLRVLADPFGLHFPPGTRFTPPSIAAPG